MILLLEKLFHSSKLENHHHHHHHSYEASAQAEASLQVFISYISVSKFQPETDTISLSWVRNCFNYLFDLNNAFARLVVEIDYPLSKWELLSIDEYLNYTLKVLDLLNLVKSSISHLSQARLTMSLSLFESSGSSAMERLNLAEFKKLKKNLKIEDGIETNFSGKELVIHLALMEMKKNSDLVFGFVLSSLSGDIKPYFELKKSQGDMKDLKGFMEKNTVLKEFKEVNEAKACLLGDFEMGETGIENVKKLEIKLEEIQKQLDDIGNKADELFSKTLKGRNEAIEVLRHRNQWK